MKLHHMLFSRMKYEYTFFFLVHHILLYLFENDVANNINIIRIPLSSTTLNPQRTLYRVN